MDSRGSVGGLFFLALILIVGVFIAFNVVSQLGEDYSDCVLNASSLSVNTTALSSSGIHSHSLAHYINEPASLVIYYSGVGKGNITFNGNWLGELSNVSPQTFRVESSMLSSDSTVGFMNLNASVQNSTVGFTSLGSCSLSDAGYRALKQTSETEAFTLRVNGLFGFMLFGIFIIGVVGLLGRR